MLACTSACRPRDPASDTVRVNMPPLADKQNEDRTSCMLEAQREEQPHQEQDADERKRQEREEALEQMRREREEAEARKQHEREEAERAKAEREAAERAEMARR